MEISLENQKTIELIGAVLGLVYLFFSIRKSLWLWPVGLLSSGFYVVVFLHSKLYAEMGLQVYYVVISIYGWYHWIFGNRNNNCKNELPVSRVNQQQIILYSGSFILIYLGLYFLLKYFTDSTVPGWDSLATALSLIATWMLAKKILENWLLWILADGLCVGIYVYKELYPTAILFIIYTLLAFVGYLNWKKAIK